MSVRYAEGSFVNARKQKVFTVAYEPSTGQARAALFFQHGYGEYVGRYKMIFTALATECNMAVYAHDVHGTGLAS